MCFIDKRENKDEKLIVDAHKISTAKFAVII